MKTVAILFAILTMSIHCAAGTITVNWDGSGDYTTIQAGIDAAVSGVDTVLVADGIYTGPGNRDIDFLGKAITVKSENGPDNCIINCQNIGRGFIFDGNEGNDSVLEGFTISNGRASRSMENGYGGGIYCLDSSPTITNCKILDCYAEGIFGGGIYCRNSNAVIRDCIVRGNRSDREGGGIFCWQGGSVIIDSCTVTNNTAPEEGGGINIRNDADAVITNCLIIGNTAGTYGGGVYLFNGNISIVNCTIAGNSAGTSGLNGGAVYCWNVRNININNCILWGNTPDEVYDDGDSNLTITYCDILSGFAGSGNISSDPLFVNPGSGDFHLMPWSVCMDAGTNSPPGGLSATDLEGNPRLIDGDRDGLTIVDMGAYERYPSTEPVISVSALEVNFFTSEEESDPEDQILTIWNSGGKTLDWTITESCGWLTVIPDSGSSTGEPNEVTLSVDISGLAWGNYNCQLTVSDPCAINNPQTVSVDLEVIGPIIELSQSSFDFQAEIDGTNPDDQILTITNIGGGTLDWTIIESCDWLTVIPDSGSSAGEPNDVTLSVDIAGLTGGLYTCELIISDPCAMNSPQIVDVNLRISGNLFVPAQFPTIQSAIDFAVGGDIVVVADGVYTGVGNRNIQLKKDNITVRSMNGPGNCIIDCEDMTRGFYIDANSVELEGFTITNGYSSIQYFGGGITVGAGNPLLISNCIITNNEAQYSGGGIHGSWGSSPIISNCIITGNLAGWYGGGLADCDDEITNCTITGNTAKDGGGLYHCDGAITNCIIWGNTATRSGDQLYSSSVPTYSCIQDWGGGGTGNISDDPLFAAGYLDPNDTPADPNDDFWVSGTAGDGDYHLRSQAGRWDPNSQSWVTDAVTSPCIDAGEPIGYWDPNSTPSDPNDDFWVWEDNSVEELWPDGGRINMGAYGGTAEASMSGNPVGSAADFNKDDSVDGLDLQMLADKWLLGEILLAEDINRNNFVDMVDVALFAQEWLIN